MADEEQPFLGSEAQGKDSKASGGIRERLWGNSASKFRIGLVGFMVLFTLGLILYLTRAIGESGGSLLQRPGSCDTLSKGYQCNTEISHDWGQYSPFFQVPSNISPDVPQGCSITFAQVLSRHGGRNPTASKSTLYAEIINKIKQRVQSYQNEFEFLRAYSYTLGADQLTAFGEQQMVLSGVDFFHRYAGLASSSIPFIRASGQERVVKSARRFSQGFHQSREAAGRLKDRQYPYDIIVISEAPGSNNTLHHGLCTEFERSRSENPRIPIQWDFAITFIPATRARLNKGLVGANLTDEDTMFLMDLCPFETIANPFGKPSEFCSLFTQDEWLNYDYYQTLGKLVGWGGLGSSKAVSSLGPTQGVGFANELIARLTTQPVDDHTSSNSTLDDDFTTFPLGRSLYADFSHDNDLTAAFFALGLYNITRQLQSERRMIASELDGYSAARTVPFAGRAFFEKMRCDGMEEEMVRVLVNGRVLPLGSCGGDSLGRCSLSNFIESLSFARRGGDWDHCFAD
ncbi:hypothetical protein ACLMJK_003183 [Lecanora helva]